MRIYLVTHPPRVNAPRQNLTKRTGCRGERGRTVGGGMTWAFIPDGPEMEFIRWQQDMRGALSRLPTDSAPWIWMPPSETPTETQISLI